MANGIKRQAQLSKSVPQRNHILLNYRMVLASSKPRELNHLVYHRQGCVVWKRVGGWGFGVRQELGDDTQLKVGNT